MNVTERRKIHNKFHPESDPHPLDGRSVSEWVAEARAGWPKVPVPADPAKAARKLAEKYSAGLDVSNWTS